MLTIVADGQSMVAFEADRFHLVSGIYLIPCMYLRYKLLAGGGQNHSQTGKGGKQDPPLKGVLGCIRTTPPAVDLNTSICIALFLPVQRGQRSGYRCFRRVDYGVVYLYTLSFFLTIFCFKVMHFFKERLSGFNFVCIYLPQHCLFKMA